MFSLTADNVFIQSVITIDTYSVDGSLWTFYYTHFQVDGVTYDVYFHRIQIIEYITLVLIFVTDSVFVCACTFAKQLLIVDITFLLHYFSFLLM